MEPVSILSSLKDLLINTRDVSDFHKGELLLGHVLYSGIMYADWNVWEGGRKVSKKIIIKPQIFNLYASWTLRITKNYKENPRKFEIIFHDDSHIKVTGQRIPEKEKRGHFFLLKTESFFCLSSQGIGPEMTVFSFFRLMNELPGGALGSPPGVWGSLGSSSVLCDIPSGLKSKLFLHCQMTYLPFLCPFFSIIYSH